MKRLKKITVRTVVGERLNGFTGDEPTGTERIVMTVYGRADKLEPVENVGLSGDISRFIRFRGDFSAYRGLVGEGEQFRSPAMILPETAATVLATLLRSDDINSANFGFEVSIKKTATPIGYEFLTMALIEEPADADPLSALASLIKKRQGARGSATVAILPEGVGHG